MDKDLEDAKDELGNSEYDKWKKSLAISVALGLSRASAETAKFVKKVNDGDEVNQFKIKAISKIDDAIRDCNILKDKIKRKKKFDAFMKNGGKKKIAIAAGAGAAVAAGAVIAKKKLSKKEDK